MLVLSRRINESIQIGNDIEIMVIDVRGDVVRLGITAPQTTQIWRKELWDIIVQENKAAAELSGFKEPPLLPVSSFSKLPNIPTVKTIKTLAPESEVNNNNA